MRVGAQPRHVSAEAWDRNYRGLQEEEEGRIMHEALEFMQSCVVLVCARITLKNVFVFPPKSSLGSFCHLFCFFFSFSPSVSILPHTFEPLCGIVPWSWLGSLDPFCHHGQLAPPPPHLHLLPFTSHPPSHTASRGTRSSENSAGLCRSPVSLTRTLAEGFGVSYPRERSRPEKKKTKKKRDS